MREQLRCCKISSQGYGVEKECCGLVCSYTQQSSDHHYTVQTSCDVYKFSFWPRAIKDWNSLPPNIILDMDSTDSFELAANSFLLHLADLQTHCLFWNLQHVPLGILQFIDVDVDVGVLWAMIMMMTMMTMMMMMNSVVKQYMRTKHANL